MNNLARRACLVVLLLVPAAARGASRSWTLRAEASSAQYSRDSFSSNAGISYTELSLSEGHGLALTGEYRPHPRLGLELSFGTVNLDAHWRQVEIRPISFNPTVLHEFVVAEDSGTLALRPITLGLLFYPVRRDRFDLYLGPQVGRTSFHVGLDGPPARGPEWTVGGKAGFDFKIARSPWSAGLAYRFLETQHEGLERDQYTGLGVHLLSAVLSYGRSSGQ